MKTIILTLLCLFQNNEATILKKDSHKEIILSTEKPHKQVVTVYTFIIQTDSTVKEIVVDKKIFTKFKVGQKFKL